MVELFAGAVTKFNLRYSLLIKKFVTATSFTNTLISFAPTICANVNVLVTPSPV